MHSVDLKIDSRRPGHGFTLLEMLVVIVIMSILMTAGAIGLGGMGGKGVASGVASAESLFDEARAIAVGQRITTRVMIAKELTNTPADNLRRVVIVSEELNPDGTRRVNADGTPVLDKWILSSRGTVLADQVYFSQVYSKKDHKSGGNPIPEMSLPASAKASYAGSYYYYEFNAEGICTTPGASLVIGMGARSVSVPTDPPKVTSVAKRDFGGFVVWRNGRTSVFRSPEQINKEIKSIVSGAKF